MRVLLLSLLVVFFACMKVDNGFYDTQKEINIFQSDNHVAFPSIEKLNEREFVCVFRTGSGHASPDGKILLARSLNKGQSWAAPDTIITTKLDCRDPSIAMLEDGSLILNFFQTKYDNKGKLLHVVGVFVSKSFDDGQTWTSPRMVLTEDYEWMACSSKILEDDDGRLLLPLYGKKIGESEQAVLYFSENSGKTWNFLSTIAYDSTHQLSYQEPVLLKMSDDRLLCVLRTTDENHFQYQCISGDGGKTWSLPQNTHLQGQAAGLLMTSGNLLYCAYRDFSPNGTSMAVSYNNGLFYENEVIIKTGTKDRGYPELIKVDENYIYCCYYNTTGKYGIYGRFFRICSPEAPDGFSASIQKDSTILMRWNRVENAHYYNVYRTERVGNSEGPEKDWNLIASVAENFYLDNRVEKGKEYKYAVKSVASSAELLQDSGAVSEFSKRVTVN